MGYSPPGSSVHGILQARILEWAAISFSRGSSQSRDGTQVSSIAGRFFTIWATREASFSLEFDHFKGSPGECLYNIKGKEEEGTTSAPSPSQNGMQIVFQKLCTPNKTIMQKSGCTLPVFWLQGMCSLSLGSFLIIELNSQFFSMTRLNLDYHLHYDKWSSFQFNKS